MRTAALNNPKGDFDMTQDDAGSAPMLGSQPVAWAADIPGKYGAAPTMLFGYTESLVRSIAAAGGDSVAPFPLYRQPQATLTKEEREAITEAARAYADNDGDDSCAGLAATLFGLLERTKEGNR